MTPSLAGAARRVDDFCAVVPDAAPDTAIERGPACALYERDVLGQAGIAACVLRPATRDDVGAILRLAHAHEIPLVAQGERTGLVGAAVPDGSGAQCVLSLSRLNRVIDVDPANRSVTVEAGMRLSALDRFLEPFGLHFPIDLGSDPSIGGLIATNAGGSRLVKHGDVRRGVLGLEAMLADEHATRLDLLAPLRKNNVGPDLKQLFIGAGGALGIVTAASLDLRQRERSSATFFVALRDAPSCARALLAFEDAFGELLGAFEFIGGRTLAAVLETAPADRPPLPVVEGHCFALVEAASAMAGLDAQLLERGTATLDSLLQAGVVCDAALGAATDFWRLRDAIPIALAARGLPLSFDVSFARPRLAPFLDEIEVWLAARHPRVECHVFGHFADGGAHLVVLVPDAVREQQGPLKIAMLRAQILRLVRARGGSISAEHGIGPLNLAGYRTHIPAVARGLAGRLQDLLDPRGVLGRVRFDDTLPPPGT